jgi:hypothetical protein
VDVRPASIGTRILFLQVCAKPIEEERGADADRYAARSPDAGLEVYADELDEGVRLMRDAGSVTQGA